MDAVNCLCGERLSVRGHFCDHGTIFLLQAPEEKARGITIATAHGMFHGLMQRCLQAIKMVATRPCTKPYSIISLLHIVMLNGQA